MKINKGEQVRNLASEKYILLYQNNHIQIKATNLIILHL